MFLFKFSFMFHLINSLPQRDKDLSGSTIQQLVQCSYGEESTARTARIRAWRFHVCPSQRLAQGCRTHATYSTPNHHHHLLLFLRMSNIVEGVWDECALGNLLRATVKQ